MLSLTRWVQTLIEAVYACTIPIRMRAVRTASFGVWLMSYVRCWVRSRLSSNASTSNRILIVAPTKLALFSGISLSELLSTKTPFEIFFACSPFMSCDVNAILKDRPGIKRVGLLDAMTRTEWHLVCFPSHYLGALFFPLIPKVFVNHGIEAGKKSMVELGIHMAGRPFKQKILPIIQN